MSRVIDISSMLSNEKTIVKIGEKEYEVNDTLEVVFQFQSMVSDMSDKDKLNKAIELTLGKAAAKEINVGKYNFKNVRVLIGSIMAAIQDEEVETILKRFQD